MCKGWQREGGARECGMVFGFEAREFFAVLSGSPTMSTRLHVLATWSSKSEII